MIESLKLTNFKCFEDQVIRFANLTVLSGLNSAGKSTVIQSLLLLRQSHMQNLLSNVGLSLNGDLFRLGTAKDALYEGAAVDEIAFTIALTDGRVSKWVFAYHRPDENVVPIKEGAEHSTVPGLFDDNFNYLQAERTGPRRHFPFPIFTSTASPTRCTGRVYSALSL